MKYFAIYDNEGKYKSFYPTDVWDIQDIPTENRIELTKDQWVEGVTLNCRVVNGVHTVITQTEEERTAIKYDQLRSTRDKLLAESDWTQMSDCPLTDAQKASWATYRQSLRDLPSTVDINNIVYPKKP